MRYGIVKHRKIWKFVFHYEHNVLVKGFRISFIYKIIPMVRFIVPSFAIYWLTRKKSIFISYGTRPMRDNVIAVNFNEPEHFWSSPARDVIGVEGIV